MHLLRSFKNKNNCFQKCSFILLLIFWNYTIYLLYLISPVKFSLLCFLQAICLFILMGTLWFAFVYSEKLHHIKKNQREFLNVKLGEFWIFEKKNDCDLIFKSGWMHRKIVLFVLLFGFCVFSSPCWCLLVLFFGLLLYLKYIFLYKT